MTNVSIEDVPQTAEDAMKEILRVCNFMSSEEEVAKGLLKALNGEHRTIQQTFFRAFDKMAKQYAEQDYADGRNQMSVDYCRRISGMEFNFPFV